MRVVPSSAVVASTISFFVLLSHGVDQYCPTVNEFLATSTIFPNQGQESFSASTDGLPDSVVAIDTVTECSREFGNSSFGTCGTQEWRDSSGRENFLVCMTDWVKERIVTIPSCGPRQLCVVAGVRRTIPGKPIRCRIYSQLQASLGRNRLWKMEIGDGCTCECKAACFNSFPMQDYTVVGVINIGDTSDSSMCIPDTVELDGTDSDCAITRNSHLWQVEGSPDYSNCSARCYSRRWPRMTGVEIVRPRGELKDSYDVCFISYVQDENTQPASCQLSMNQGLWWFEENGLHCQAMCACDAEDKSTDCQPLPETQKSTA